MISAIVAAMFALGGPSYQEGTLWAATAVSKDNSGMTYLDLSSMSKSGSLVRAWTATVFTNSFKYGNKDVFAMRDFVEFDCEQRRQRAVSRIAYSRDGEVVTQYNREDAEWSYNPPGTTGFGAIQVACGLTEPQTLTPGSDPIKMIDLIISTLSKK
ncbi:surface-adhesin E family protein [Sphingomonas sp. R1]|uniref:surface-adhesin E family protein n=1 Tax=Sphingomonas sp. R1 TaxID=399176 RepID=UPI0022243338|nr:surface-adhesin E family protein [Sphingomonas sp. R1]UYY77507.1 hypothetical protein OIM94_00390 [Sphingomonas sp. R1]